MKDTPKKIIYVITKSNWGGAQRYVFDMAVHFAVQGYSVKVAMGGSGPLFDKLKLENIETIEIPNMARDISLLGELKSFIFLYRLFRREKPDVVHLNSSKAGLGALAARLAFVKRIIFTMHGMASHENRNFLQKKLINLLYFITIHLCHKTITVSNTLVSQIVAISRHLNTKLVPIHNGIEHHHLKAKLETKARLMQIIEEKFGPFDFKMASQFIGTIGELHHIKGHIHLLKGFRAAMKDSAVPLYLFIIGEGEERKVLETEINNLSLKHHVFLCGHIQEAHTLLKAFDIFVLPSLSEGLPYVVLEAGLAQIPVIATAVGGISEIIDDGETGILVKAKSNTDITDALLTLIFDPNMRRVLGTNLHKKVTEEFSIEQMFTETKKVYNI